jgi:hypothetical protein
MNNKLPSDTEALLRAIANQPDHKLPISALSSLKIPQYKERLKELSRIGFVKNCDYKTYAEKGVLVTLPESVCALAPGLDYLRQEESLSEALRRAEDQLKKEAEKAAYWENKYHDLEGRGNRTARIWALITAVVSASVGALITYFLSGPR